jgi:hypothetical protein
MVTIVLLLRFVAFLLFVCAAVGVPARVNLQALGLAVWVASLFVVA